MVKEEQEAHPTHTQTHDSISVIDWHWFINPFNLMLTSIQVLIKLIHLVTIPQNHLAPHFYLLNSTTTINYIKTFLQQNMEVIHLHMSKHHTDCINNTGMTLSICTCVYRILAQCPYTVQKCTLIKKTHNNIQDLCDIFLLFVRFLYILLFSIIIGYVVYDYTKKRLCNTLYSTGLCRHEGTKI